ncbi:MAG: PilC/PilY family type IV pilus protein, partial [Pseudomonadales bacterium]
MKQNTGDLIAQEFNEDGEITNTVWSAAGQLDLVDFADRQIMTYDPDAHVARPFRATGCGLTVGSYTADGCLTLDQFESLVEFFDGSELLQVSDRIDYFRGDSSNERPSGVFRERPDIAGRLGDIVNASPVFVGPPQQLRRTNLPYPQGSDLYTLFQDQYQLREPLIYVSANDGMMHAFEADTGDEHLAFVPNAVMTGTFNRKIVELLNYEYTHKYLMDVTPAINDVFVDPAGGLNKSWRTMIVGGYGAGGKGYFAIDGTDPTVMTEAAGGDVVFWEFTDDDDTYPTDAHDGSGLPLDDGAGGQRFDLQSPAQPVKDLGYSFSVPTIAMSNVKDADGEQEWVVMFGNGFNSTSGIAKLFVLFSSRGNDGVWCHPDSVFDDDLDPNNGPVRTGCAADAQDFVKLDTGFGVPASGPLAGFPNGLGTPRG